MDINQIMDIISPYFTVAGMTTLITIVATTLAKMFGYIKKATSVFKNIAILNEDAISKKMAEVLPKDLQVKITPIVNSEIVKIREMFQASLTEIEAKSNEKLDAIIVTLSKMRNIPEETRKALIDVVESERQNAIEQPVVTLNYELEADVQAIAGNEEQEQPQEQKAVDVLPE